MTAATWLVRTADDAGPGRPISLERLAQGITDGVWREEDQVRGPQDMHWRQIGDHSQLEEFLPPVPLFRRSAGGEAEMDMTPMIDVVFQLLIFFMIAATYTLQKTLDLPQAQANQEGASSVTMQDVEKTNVLVVLDEGGQVLVEGQPTALDDLENAIRAARDIKQTGELALDAADGAAHELVVRVLDAAAGAQINQVHFIKHVGNSPAGGGGP
ncbi:MAG: biopolymer transporter ExbD [Pirellulales bacterium]|nr:biopolymer transporter ExbD [Pirellulales bacterium]